MRAEKRITGMIAALAMVAAAGCTARTDASEAASFVANERDVPKYLYREAARVIQQSPISLERFDSCAPLLGHLRLAAAKQVSAWGLNDGGFYRGGGVRGGDFMTMLSPATADSTGSRQSASGGSSGSFSTTNVQEAGVDEPDIIKNDGKRILAVAQGRLHWLGIVDGRAKILGSMTLPGVGHGSELLVDGNRALLFENGYGFDGISVPRDMPPSMRQAERSTISVVDITKPETMRVLATLHLEGSYVSARMVKGIARVVIRSGPGGIDFPQPTAAEQQGQINEKLRIKRNKNIVKKTTLDNWLPNFVLEDKRGSKKRVTQGRVSSCDATHRTKDFSGFGATTVLTLDPNNPTPKKGTTVLGDAQIVYASPERLYVSTNRWTDRPEAMAPQPGLRAAPAAKITTQIHAFDISDPTTARYTGSGVVTGHVLNQWSFSEHAGYLRVASTMQDWNGGTEKSESFVTVLSIQPGALVQAGRVGGLGLGERIYGVRFMGKLGYVVTFRQVDPLYVIDLSDPARPRKTGELKIPGYSAYLHPVGDGLLLGVGASATNEGRRTGLQLSMFDVSDPAKPNRIHLATMDNAYSDVEYTHLAFLWWPETKTVLLPVSGAEDKGVYGQWMQGFAVDKATGIDKIAAIKHKPVGGGTTGDGVSSSESPGEYNPVQRSVVIGELVLTLSNGGFMTSSLSGLTEKGWLTWPKPPVRKS